MLQRHFCAHLQPGTGTVAAQAGVLWQVSRGKLGGDAVGAEDLRADQLDVAEGKRPAATVALLHLLQRQSGPSIDKACQKGMERRLAA